MEKELLEQVMKRVSSQNQAQIINITVRVPGLPDAFIHMEFEDDLLTYASLSIGDIASKTVIVYKDGADELWVRIGYFGNELWIADPSAKHIDEFFDFIETLTKLVDALSIPFNGFKGSRRLQNTC